MVDHALTYAPQNKDKDLPQTPQASRKGRVAATPRETTRSVATPNSLLQTGIVCDSRRLSGLDDGRRGGVQGQRGRRRTPREGRAFWLLRQVGVLDATSLRSCALCGMRVISSPGSTKVRRVASRRTNVVAGPSNANFLVAITSDHGQSQQTLKTADMRSMPCLASSTHSRITNAGR